MDAIGADNASRGLPAGRGHSGASHITDTPPPRVSSAAMIPLSPEEQARRDARARELGLLEPDPDNTTGTWEDAAAAGAPVYSARAALAAGENSQENLRSIMAATLAPPSEHVMELARRQVAAERQFGNLVTPRLPDFRNVQTFDLQRGVMLIDGMTFPIPVEDQTWMKSYAVTVALNDVVKQLALALQEFGLPPHLAEAAAAKLRETARGGNEAVPAVLGRQAGEGVQQEDL